MKSVIVSIPTHKTNSYTELQYQVQIAVPTLPGNSLRQTVHTHRASLHQTAKLVAALLRVAGLTAGLGKVMAAYRRVYDHVTCRLTAKNRDQLRNPTLGGRVWATFTFLQYQTTLSEDIHPLQMPQNVSPRF